MSKIILLSVDAIKTAQDGIRKNLIKLDLAVHENAVQCLLHAQTHGDTSLMRRLLVEIVDAKSGYRRQGLINWMRKHSPMELKGDLINLSGLITSEGQVTAMKKMWPEADPKLFVVGERRPFMIEEANANPFWNDRDNAERVAKPIYKDTLLSKVDTMYKEVMAAAENTANGKAIDPSKPFYDGVHLDKVVSFAEAVKKMRDELPADATREVRLAQQRIKDDTALVESHNKADDMEPEVKVA